MNHTKILLSAALAGIMAAGVAGTAAAQGKVKCYGVSKAGQNGCASADGSHSCAGQATKDYDKNEWQYVESADACKAQGGGQTPDEAESNPGPQ